MLSYCIYVVCSQTERSLAETLMYGTLVVTYIQSLSGYIKCREEENKKYYGFYYMSANICKVR